MSEPPTLPSTKVRYHDLDALRAFAMLLGIFLHALCSFIGFPGWPAQDVRSDPGLWGVVVAAMHGFRMPLFFVMSGFFTAMLWRKRGMASMLGHRALRIFIPLVIGMVTVVPLLFLIGAVAPKDGRSTNIWEAAAGGKIEQVKEYLDSGGDIHATFVLEGIPGSGGSPLHLAVMGKQKEVAKLLIERGADVDAPTTDGKGGRPLHWAVWFNHVELAGILVKAGADVDAENTDGVSPLELARGIDRKQMVELMLPLSKATEGGRGAEDTDPGPKDDPAGGSFLLEQIFGFLVAFPLLGHLWFLGYLCWLIAGFAVAAGIARKLGLRQPPSWLIRAPLCLLWLVPLTWFWQLTQTDGFGPNTRAGIIPSPPLLALYGVFFGYGALMHGIKGPDKHATRGFGWIGYLLLALAVLPFGVLREQVEFFHFMEDPKLFALVEALYVWLMVFAFMGLFRLCFSGENPRIRYISDSAYWLYLAHLPLVQILQIWVRNWEWPALAKAALICVITVGILLPLYHVAVRYTFIGTLLNGKRVRPPRPVSAEPD